MADEELDSLALESTQTIDVEKFVLRSEIETLSQLTVLPDPRGQGRAGRIRRDPGGDGPQEHGGPG